MINNLFIKELAKLQTMLFCGENIKLFKINILAENVTEADGIITLLKTVMNVVKFGLYFAGAALSIWGIVNLGLGFRDENANKKEKAMQDIIGGVIVLIGAVLIQTVLFSQMESDITDLFTPENGGIRILGLTRLI